MKINTIKTPSEKELFDFLSQHFSQLKIENKTNPILGIHYIQIRVNAFKGVVVKLNKENQIIIDKTIPSIIGRSIPLIGVIANLLGKNLASETFEVLSKQFGKDSR